MPGSANTAVRNAARQALCPCSGLRRLHRHRVRLPLRPVHRRGPGRLIRPLQQSRRGRRSLPRHPHLCWKPPHPASSPGLEKQPAYYKAEFEKLSQGKKTDFNFAACFLGFWHTLYRGCWRRFLLLYSWLGVLTAASGLVAAHELETVVMMNTAYASAAWHWDGTVSAFISAVLMLQVAVALYNGTTFNEYYYKVCRREASDAEKRQIGLVAGVLVSVAAAVGVLAFAVYSYGNGKVQGTLYRQRLLEDAAVRGPQVQQR